MIYIVLLYSKICLPRSCLSQIEKNNVRSELIRNKEASVLLRRSVSVQREFGFGREYAPRAVLSMLARPNWLHGLGAVWAECGAWGGSMAKAAATYAAGALQEHLLRHIAYAVSLIVHRVPFFYFIYSSVCGPGW